MAHFVGTGWDLAGFPLARAAQKLDKPITCLPAIHPGTWGDAQLDTDLYRQMDAIFCLSDYEAEHLVREGVPQEKTIRVGCASSSKMTGDAIRFRRTYDLVDKEIVLFVGRKSREKGYHSLRRAIAQLAEAGRSVVLVSIGREVDPPFPALPVHSDLDLGAADEWVKQDAMAACDMFALPSEAESFGIVYTEAWAYGKPVICGIAPASRELVNRHGGGLTTDGSPECIGNAVKTIFNDANRAKQMGESGRLATRTEYTMETVLKRHLATWNQLRSQQEK